MRLLERFRRGGRGAAGRGQGGRGRGRTGRTPSFGEMRARMRTERAEARLLETEAKIHQEAARYRLGRRRAG
ncbi:hypothetical protein GCM10023085_26160 [Actinomadura viridis]|uniref:Uncharacterized protein n=1 Tax=Actinomadura viridis TaxID=58110 RepID=A0A931DDY1_9ACTN|nr:hypothetical protein [Actinomadura viridis]MBG6087397.1 hypothetical protein [Actinomadura viridis]